MRGFRHTIPNVVLAIGALTHAARAQPEWTPSTPDTRAGHALAHDSLRGRTVLFGGDVGDTWEWDGNLWERVATTGPTPRVGHAMVFDALRGRVVLFGGFDIGGNNSETWEWDGAVWTQRFVTGPTPRREHAMVYDSLRGRVLLFSGTAAFGTQFGDLWSWDGAMWSQLPVTGPAARESHAMVYDSQRDRTVLFGGIANSGELNDTWEWDGNVWRQFAVTAPPVRGQHAMVYDANRGRTYLHGGIDAGATAPIRTDAWEWDGVSWQQSTMPRPTDRFEHAMVFDSNRGRAVMFGGRFAPASGGPTTLGDTWELGASGWGLVAATGPFARTGHAIVWDSARQRALLFGGAASLPTGPAQLRDTWIWDGVAWSDANALGSVGREEHAMAYDSARDRVVMFGGITGSTVLGDTWEFDGVAWTQVTSTGPSPRYGHTMAYDSSRRRVVLFGGVDRTLASVADTWEWDGMSWAQVATSGPAAREQHAMVFDEQRGRTVMFGGAPSFLTRVGDTWEWDGVAWSLVATTGPAPRAEHAMAYDSLHGRTVLFGGNPAPSTPFFADTWEFDGVSWSTRGVLGPDPRSHHVMVHVASSDHVMLFGGFGGSFFYGDLSDTWHLDTPLRVFGRGCDGTAGVPLLLETTNSTPRVGATFGLEVGPLAASAVAFGAVGFARLAPSVPLDIIGAPGCALHIEIIYTELLPVGGTTAPWNIAIANDATLAGIRFDLQALVLDAGANPLGLTTSTAAEAVVR